MKRMEANHSAEDNTGHTYLTRGLHPAYSFKKNISHTDSKT